MQLSVPEIERATEFPWSQWNLNTMYREIERESRSQVLLIQACYLKAKGPLSVGTWVFLLDLIFQGQGISFNVLLLSKNICHVQLELHPQMALEL